MTLQQLKSKFDGVLTSLNSNTSINFCKAVEQAYEALTLVNIMQEYARVLGGVSNLAHPTSAKFLNQSPGRFSPSRSFKVSFNNGQIFYFAADIEINGLNAMGANIGTTKFEADVVVIEDFHENDIATSYKGYPAPQHLDSVYECKFGSYNKGQLRELLGLRRHISYLGNGMVFKSNAGTEALFSRAVNNSRPAIALKMVRPAPKAFFDTNTEYFYDLQQIIVN